MPIPIFDIVQYPLPKDSGLSMKSHGARSVVVQIPQA
jgi:hypothetical protein